MNKNLKPRFTVITLFFLCMVQMFIARQAYPFTTAGQYRSHTGGSKTCVDQKCHPGLAPGKRAFGHRPSDDGQCGACHSENAYPARFGLQSDQSIACASCHKDVDLEIRSSSFVHGPIKSGDCSSCHDPHGSGFPFMLKRDYSSLCSQCHSLKGLYSGSVVHKPVADGNCGLCHDPHASNYRARLTDPGAGLCLSCHEDMVSGMASDYVHTPLLKTGCTECHDPHSGSEKLRLRTDASRLCFSCHDEKKNETEQYVQKHPPAADGRCAVCHSPHFSEMKYLLRDRVNVLCYSCHKDKDSWEKRRFRHGPLVQGNCVACHSPHGSDNAFILRMAFPYKFYTKYESGTYSLCFNCHKEAIVTTERTVTATNFRNGDFNLHRFHVNQEKGRTCRACHDIHASDQEFHIREEFPFGSSFIPMYYTKTPTGGTCTPGCHKQRKYDRLRMIENKQ